jgi:tRNA nucleotidyltransferase (CCA-adding enzyme)
MDVITTHLNADFDCLGAMVAARRLYPDALLVFPGAQEKSMRDFFLKSTSYLLDFTRLKDLDFARIRRLIIVDCQHAARIGRFAELLNHPEVEVHVYDHHPETTGDIVATAGTVRVCGSTTTILALMLMEQGIELSAMEATLMMLGIYEDTGSLRFPSTTVDDFRAAGWLLTQGALLNTVADCITQELTPEQVSLLNDLLHSLKTTTLHGVEISIAHASLDYYVGDVATLAHMMRDMENLQVLFLAVGMGNRVYLVARSRIAEVDVGKILREFGGGGHATAASAAVRDLTLIQVLARLEEVLKAKVNPRRLARDIMSQPVKILPAELTIAAARDQLTRYNVNAMPIVRDGQMIGVISRRIVERAIYHGLATAPVTDYMHSEFMRATPETPITEIQEYIVGQNRRLVPVFAGQELIGVVTRTDLLRSMHAEEALYDLGRGSSVAKGRALEPLLLKSVSSATLALLRHLGQAGDDMKLPVAAVGGFVRDLLLGTENTDLDVTVEGDGIAFAEAFARKHGARVRPHHKFGTAVVIFPDDSKVDVASTRLEYYESPGALPSVEHSSLKMDLYRRDFTINTLAIRLNTDQFGHLVDYFGGQRDIQDRVIRVLHNLSFVEDPTRVFRAIRFEQRLGFHIASHTENLIKNAVKLHLLDALGGKRLLTELVLILREKEPLKAVQRMAGLGLLTYIHPRLHLSEQLHQLFRDAQEVVSWYTLLFLGHSYAQWQVFFLILCHNLSEEEFAEGCHRLAIGGQRCRAFVLHRAEVFRLAREFSRYGRQHNEPRPSDIYHAFTGVPDEFLLYLMAMSPQPLLRRVISHYFTHLQHEHCLINGKDLRALGIPPGPLYAKILRTVLDARLDGTVQSRDEEVRLAATIWQESGQGE